MLLQVPTGSGEATGAAELTDCVDADFNMEELLKCVKKPTRGKASGPDVVMVEMILDGGSCMHEFTVQMFHDVAGRENLSVGLIRAGCRSRDVNDMGNNCVAYISKAVCHDVEEQDKRLHGRQQPHSTRPSWFQARLLHNG